MDRVDVADQSAEPARRLLFMTAMPELLTKHPEVAIQVLEGGGARCGPGQEQEILKQCRPERFCKTETGETCVFGLDEIGAMTQITKQELAERVCVSKAGLGGCEIASSEHSAPFLFALGLAFFSLWRRRARSRVRRG